jgi:hypothetical protein
MTTREALLEKFLSGSSYDRHLCLELIATGKAADAANWDTRCLAALMLETHFLRIPARCLQEQQWLAAAAGFPDDEPSVRTLRRRLSRLKYLHMRMRGPATHPQALLDFLHVAAQPCRLWFARGFFSADETARRILASVRTSRGVRGGLNEGEEWPRAAREHLAELPGLEQQVATALSENDYAYWVAETTPSEINSLVEYPLGTIALVIKLPGSDLELEIKRVGLRGPNVLSALFGPKAKVPWSHRLQGGSTGCMIDSEARGALRIGALYRAIHGAEAPVSFVLDMQTVHTLPGRTGDAGLLSYFTEREEFGDNFDQMRDAMAQSVEAFEEGEQAMDLPGDLGLTIRFLRHLAPKQALISGTSSFRLDTLSRYLSSEGPNLYFRQGLKRDYSPTDARQLADDLLAEVLGVYTPPKIPYDGHAEYVGLALQVPANRLRADRTYLSLMRQIGKFWGTLAGLGAYTRGEIFVARNVGLRSRFIRDRWRVYICFMDHDNTVVPWRDCGEIDPLAMALGMRHDAHFIVDENFSLELARGAVGCLRRIYQPGPDVAAAGAVALFDTARINCRKTKAAMKESKEVGSLIDPVFLRSKADWDELVRSWLRDGGSRDAVSAEWEAGARRTLAAKGFDEAKASAYIHAIKKERRFLSGFEFLYDSGYRDFSRSNWQAGG